MWDPGIWGSYQHVQHNYLNNFYTQEAGELHIKELRRFAEPLFKKLLTKIAEAYNVHACKGFT